MMSLEGGKSREPAAAAAILHTTPGPLNTEDGHTFTREFPDVQHPDTDIQVALLNGKLLITARGQTEEIQLPEDAFTTHTRARFQRGTLTVFMQRKDPNSPAMLEKKAFDPDGPHPRQIPLETPGIVKPRPPDVVGHGQPTPAQAAMAAHSTDDRLLANPPSDVAVPEAGLAGTVASDLPAVTLAGGAIAAPSTGETVARDFKSTDTHMVTRGVDELKLKEGGVPAVGPLGIGTTVVQGAREKMIEAEYGTADKGYNEAARNALHLGATETGANAPGATDADQAEGAAKPEDRFHAAAPAGEAVEGQDYDDEYEDYDDEYEEGEYEDDGVDPKLKLVHDIDHKVGLTHEQRTAADFYPRADSDKVEPISSMKQQVDVGGHGCDLCECNPCQCGKANFPLEMAPAETKRQGRAAMHHHENKSGPATMPQGVGRFRRGKKDFRGHARPAMVSHENKVPANARMTAYDNEHPGAVKFGKEVQRSSSKDAAEVAAHEQGDHGRQAGEPGSKFGHPGNYTGGRVIQIGTEGIHLSTGRHEKVPHVLG